MPIKPLKPCKHPVCPELTNQNFCERHRHQHQRATSKARGYDNRWRAERKKYLQAHPLCVRCE
ncbi:MAG: HNH endonuclease, partial [Niameybacter sp.]